MSVSSYRTVFGAGLRRYLLNSVLLTAACIAPTVTISLGAAFRIVRRASRAVSDAFVVMLFGLAIPVQAIIVPLYVLICKMHLYDTLFALILTLTAAAIPVSVLITGSPDSRACTRSTCPPSWPACCCQYCRCWHYSWSCAGRS
jgi:ABC-type glycerol-3-phosphate transport system permease component